MPGSVQQRMGFDALGFDPAPGSLAAVETLAATHTSVARSLTEAYDGLTRIGSAGGSWQGAAADSFRGTVSELPAYLDKARRSLGEAASVLGGWQADLAAMQRAADRLEQEAVQARRRFEDARAQPDLGFAGQYFPDDEQLRAAEQRLANAQAAVQRAEADLDAVIGAAERLRGQHTDLGDQVADALRRAKDLAPDEPGFFEEWGARIGGALDAANGLIADTVVDAATASVLWVQDNANVIAALSDVTADLSTMTGLLGLGLDATVVGAPAGVVLGAVSSGLSLLALGGHAVARAGGANVPNETLIWDAVGASTFGIGKLGQVGKAAADGIGYAVPILQADREHQYGDRAATIFDDLGKYWVPRDARQMAESALLSPIAVAYENAITDGMAADEKARQERAGR